MKSGRYQIVGAWLGSLRGTDWENGEANRCDGGVHVADNTLIIKQLKEMTMQVAAGRMGTHGIETSRGCSEIWNSKVSGLCQGRVEEEWAQMRQSLVWMEAVKSGLWKAECR